MLIELTSSQLMALKSLLAEYIMQPQRTLSFIDCSSGEPGGTETTPEELLAALVNQDPV